MANRYWVPAASVDTYYFDGSDAAASNTGLGTDWSDVTNADDGSTATDATVTLSGFFSSKELLIEGTNAPASGGTITQVRARVYGSRTDATATLFTDIATDGDAEEIYSNIAAPATEGWSDYATLSTPTGGWTWAKVQALESRSTASAAGDSGDFTLSRIEIEVTSSSDGGNWNDTTHWSDTTGGTGGFSVPTSADDVFFDGNSGTGTTTLNVAPSCRSLDCLGFTGTISHPASTTINIGDSTAGAGNRALRFVAGMTYTKGSDTSSAIRFASTSTTQQDVTTGGQVLGNTDFNGTGGSWRLTDAFTANDSSITTLTLTRGTFDTNNQTVTVSIFNSDNSNSRTLTLGSSTINIENELNIGIITGLTLNRGTSTINFTDVNAFFYMPSSGTVTLYNLTRTGTAGAGSMNIYGSTSQIVTTATLVVNNLNIVPISTYGLVDFNSRVNITVQGTLTASGNAQNERVLIQSNLNGETRTITAESVSLSNVDFRGITAAGTASPFSGTSIGNASGNSNITFTSAVTRYFVGGGTSQFMKDTANWSESSGGTSGATVPLPQDTAVFDASSASASFSIWGGDTYNGILGNVDCSAIDDTLEFIGNRVEVCGNVTLSSNFNFNQGGFEFIGWNNQSFTLNGATSSASSSIRITKDEGTVTLQDTLNLPHTNFTMYDSKSTVVFDANDNNITLDEADFWESFDGSYTVNMGAGTWTLTGTGTVWGIFNDLGTINAETSTIVINNTTATSKTFIGRNVTYNNITFTGDNIIIQGNNTFNNFNVNNAGLTNGLKFTANTTQTINGNFTTNGSTGNLAIITSTTTSPFTLSKSSGTVAVDYMNISYSTATGGAGWYAGTNSTNGTGNTGWEFTDPPTIESITKSLEYSVVATPAEITKSLKYTAISTQQVGDGPEVIISQTDDTAVAHSIYDQKWGMQQFTLDATETITRIDILMGKNNGTTGDVNVDIYAQDGSGEITGSVLTTGSVVYNDLTGSPGSAFAQFDLTPTALSAGDYLAVVKFPNGNVGSGIWARLIVDNTNPYAGGYMLRTYDAGSTYNHDTGLDFAFELYAGVAGKSLSYRVTTTPSATQKTLDYSVRNVEVIQKSAKYTVLTTPTPITKSLTYAIDNNERYWVGGTGDWTDSSHWALSSGGAGGADVPEWDIEEVIFDTNSFTANGQTVSNVSGSFWSLDASTVQYTITLNQTGSMYLQGDLLLNSNITISGNNEIIIDPWNGASGRTINIDYNGAEVDVSYLYLYGNYSNTFNVLSDILMTDLSGDGLANSFQAISLYGDGSSTVNTNGNDLRVVTLNVTEITVNLGTSTITVADLDVASSATLNSSSADLIILHTDSIPRSLYEARSNRTWNSVTIDSQNVRIIAHASAVQINATTFTIAPASVVEVFSTSLHELVVNATNFNISGTSSNQVVLASPVNVLFDSVITMNKTTGSVTGDYITAYNTNVGGGATWYKGTGFTGDNADNDGWRETVGPITKSLHYETRDTSSITKSLNYTVLTDTPITKSLEYAVKTANKVETSVITNYYFDSSDASVEDANAVFTDDANVADGSLSTYAYTTTAGSRFTNHLRLHGTNAPASGGTITQVRTRFYGEWVLYPSASVSLGQFVYENGQTGNNYLGGGGTTFNPNTIKWGGYLTLSEPAGGWTWAALQSLDTVLYFGSTWGEARFYTVELEVTHGDDISLTYTVKSSSNAQKSLKYTVVSTPTATTKSLKYAITTTATPITKSLEYTVVATETYNVQKSLTYRIITTPSALTKSLEYIIRDTSTIQKSLKYTVETTAAQITKSLGYYIITTPTAITKSLTYAIITSDSVTKNLKYAVITTPSATQKSLEYILRWSTALNKSLKYTILTDSVVQKSLHYETRDTSSITKSLKYAVLTTPSSVARSLKYTVVTTATPLTKNLSYAVTTNTAVQKTLRYAVVAPATPIQKSLKYTVVAPATPVTKSLKYTVLTTTNPVTKALEYFVKPSTTIQKSLKYTVFSTAAPLQKTLDYQTLNLDAVTKALKYTVKVVGVGITKNLTYDILTTDSVTKSLTYRVAPSVTVQKSTKYTVVAPATPLTKSLTYDVTSEVAIQRSLKYTTISTPAETQKSLEYQVIVVDNDITKSLTYIVVSSADVNKQLKYTVVSSVAPLTRSLQYSVIPTEYITKSLKYTVKILDTSQTLQLTYSVLTNDLVNKTLVYGVVSSAEVQKSLKYVVVRTPNAVTKELFYVLNGGNLAQKALRYRVLSTPTQKTKSLAYRIITILEQAKSLRYAMVPSVTVQKALKYTVETTTTVQESLTYAPLNINALTKAVKYTINSAVSPSQKTLQYAVFISHRITKGVEYQIVTTPVVQKSLKYTVEAQTAVPQKSLTYTVITTAPVIKSLDYQIVTQQPVSLSLNYVVESSATIIKSLTYSVSVEQTAIIKSLTYNVSSLTPTSKNILVTGTWTSMRVKVLENGVWKSKRIYWIAN